jgi:hypothetical protein
VFAPVLNVEVLYLADQRRIMLPCFFKNFLNIIMRLVLSIVDVRDFDRLGIYYVRYLVQLDEVLILA